MAVETVEATIRVALPPQRDARLRSRGPRLSIDETVALVLALDPVPV